MNDKLRFIVLTLIMIILLPFTFLFIFFGWLMGDIEDLTLSYIKFYKDTWS